MTLKALLVIVALVGATAPGSSAAAGTCGDADEPRSSQRSDPFFTVEHPPTHSVTLSTGLVVPMPFAVYEADMSLVYGLVDAAKVEKIMDGSGHKPIVTRDRAIARLMIWELDTAVGPYEELAVFFDSSTEEIDVPWVNAYSSFVPSVDPRNTYYMHKLILDRWPSIHWGREVLGFDKIFGCIDIERTGDAVRGTTRTFAFRDTQGRAVLSGHLNEPDMAVSTALHARGLAEALGQTTPLRSPSHAPEIVFGGVSPDAMSVERNWKYNVVNSRLNGVVTEFDGELRISSAAPIGRELIDLGFEPTVVLRDPHFMFVMDLATDGTPLIP